MKLDFRFERSPMTRGGVTILVLVGLIGRLVVPVSHVHANYTPAQHIAHNAVPHVHIGDASHTHDHGYPAHHHEDELSQSPNADVGPGALSAPEKNHDSDVVWFPSASGSTLCVKAKSHPVGLDAAASQPIAAFYGEAIRGRFGTSDLRASSSKLYITLRTLRI